MRLYALLVVQETSLGQMSLEEEEGAEQTPVVAQNHWGMKSTAGESSSADLHHLVSEKRVMN